MICEKAEGFLSAYLDDMLDLQHRRDVEAHVESCAHCRAVLEDYRRFDFLLEKEPRVAPPEDLYARIVESPEFVAITRSRERGERGGVLTALRSVARPETREAAPVQGVPPGVMDARGSRRVLGVARVALQTAAVLALLLGSALLLKQGLFHSGGTTGQSTMRSYGAPAQNSVPLAAGARVVFAHDGALWSAPEVGPGVAQRLTSVDVRAGGWSVSPDGTLVAYIDEASGRLLVIRSDDQNNHVVAKGVISGTLDPRYWATDAGKAINAGVAWSPNGDRIAYLAGSSSSMATVLHIVNVDGSNDVTIATGGPALLAQPTWSSDGLQVAFTRVENDAQGVYSYDAVTRQVNRLAAQADADNVSARVDRLIWLPDTVSPMLTWATRDGSAYSGIFSSSSLQSSVTALRLTPAGMHFAVVDFTAHHDGGSWVVAPVNDNPMLSTVSAHVAGLVLVASPPGEVRSAQWSPTGDSVAFVTMSGRLGLWSPWNAHAHDVVMLGIAGHVTTAPAWSRTGTRLAVPTASGVVSLHVADGSASGAVRLTSSEDVVTLLWAGDSKRLALAGTRGVTLVSDDGAVIKRVDAHVARDGVMAWTLAG